MAIMALAAYQFEGIEMGEGVKHKVDYIRAYAISALLEVSAELRLSYRHKTVVCHR